MLWHRIAFVPLAVFGAGLPLTDAVIFAVGLLVGNVPEGLLPVITLALAVGVRELVRKGAVVKRLSAVETLGSTDVICTDKTGTLTQNRMRVTSIWAAPQALERLAHAVAACNNARLSHDGDAAVGDPTEIAMLEAAAERGADTDVATRERQRRRQFHFDPSLKLMSTVDERAGDLGWTPRERPKRSCRIARRSWGTTVRSVRLPLPSARRWSASTRTTRTRGCAYSASPSAGSTGTRPSPSCGPRPRATCFLGLVAMLDPPRPEVADAVAACHAAGIRIVVITGDNGPHCGGDRTERRHSGQRTDHRHGR